MFTLVPEMKRKSLERDGLKKAIRLSTVSYAATWNARKGIYEHILLHEMYILCDKN